MRRKSFSLSSLVVFLALRAVGGVRGGSLNELLEELIEVTTTRKKWWVIKFEDGFYGEVVDEAGDSGFDLKLFAKKAQAVQAAKAFLEGEDLAFEVVEIAWSVVR